MSKPTMTMSDEVESLAAELRIRTAERDALQARVARQPAMREVIGQLVAVLVEIQDRENRRAEKRLKELIQRMDLERP